MPKTTETATLASGCFWCTEAVFQRLKGITSVTSGYTGGHTESPSYEEVSSGKSGHAEAIQIEFDPKITTYEKLLDVFWSAHDPTTLNRQGNDVGPQYRSAIFYHSEEQRKVAEASKQKLEGLRVYDDPIVTEITQFTAFYAAEKYHQDFYNNNRRNGYCQLVIDPKLKKLLKDFKKDVATTAA